MPAQLVLSGSWTLPEQERELALNEAASWELVSVQRQSELDGCDNVAAFKRLPIGDQPGRLRLALASDPPPPGAVKLFECELTVAGVSARVGFYRNNPAG